MKIYTIAFILLLISTFQVNAAAPRDEWHYGEIVLSSGEKLQGSLNYTDELVQCNTHNLTKAFSTLQVSHFQFFDPTLNVYRTFVPVDFSMAEGVKRPAFYELVSEGIITLLRKEKYTYQLANETYKERDLAYDTQSLERFQHDVHMRVQDFEYFYVYNGKFHPLHNFRKEMSPIMASYETEISHYIEQNLLNPKEMESQVKIVEFYNQLSREKNVALRR
jgi:hypothetical protein